MPRCPFPGMDPYIELPAIWADFHDRLIPIISSALQPQLRPKYVALVQDRLYVVQSARPIYPDIAVVEAGSSPGGARAGSAVMELDQPVVFEFAAETIRQPYITIIEPAAGNRLVTSIEVISPDNKTAGAGRRKHLKKLKELWTGGANIVEIDLLRAGKPLLRVSDEELTNLASWHYLAGVRRQPNLQAVYPIVLQSRLPRLAIPLAPGDEDARLDLQAAFTRCWEEGPYPEVLRYDGPPPGNLTAEELGWCDEQLRKAGYRSAPKIGRD